MRARPLAAHVGKGVILAVIAVSRPCLPVAAAAPALALGAPHAGGGAPGAATDLDSAGPPTSLAWPPHLAPPGPRPLSKKAEWLHEKARPRARLTGAAGLPPPGSRIEPVVTLVHTKTREALPILPGPLPTARFDSLLRDHFTNQATEMDAQLLEALTRAARHYGATRIDIVSGYRSPKYNLMLRKKGRQVAAESQHTHGRAVDFRVRGVAPAELLRFVRGLKLGGVGFYPHSQFVHCDTGPVRFWRGS